MARICVSKMLFSAMLLGAFQLCGADYKPDAEGFILNWLMLAPIPVPEGQGATDVDKEQVKDESKLAPKEGDKSKAGDKELAWKAAVTKDYYIDFNEILPARHEDVAGYLVCYADSAEELKDVTLAIGSNDFAKVYLNGKAVAKVTEPGQIDKDKEEVKGLTLNKGVNTVIFKIINDKNNWQGALRFKKKDGTPVTALTIKLAP